MISANYGSVRSRAMAAATLLAIVVAGCGGRSSLTLVTGKVDYPQPPPGAVSPTTARRLVDYFTLTPVDPDGPARRVPFYSDGSFSVRVAPGTYRAFALLGSSPCVAYPDVARPDRPYPNSRVTVSGSPTSFLLICTYA